MKGPGAVSAGVGVVSEALGGLHPWRREESPSRNFGVPRAFCLYVGCVFS